MEYKIAIGLDPGRVQTKSLEWDVIVDRLSRHEVAVTKGGRYFVGGAFSAPERTEANLVCRSMLTLDIDDAGMHLRDLEFMLIMKTDCAFVAYSTFTHTPDKPRVRIVVPLSREVTPGEYREVSRRFGDALGIKLDPGSYKPNQYMYLPATSDLSQAWSLSQDGEPHPVPDDVTPAASTGAADDLEDMVSSQPLDISDDAVDAYLSAYDPEVLEYDHWLLVGAALHHQYEGSQDRGYARWLAWSQCSSKHDAKHMPNKWRSFGKSRRRATFASVIWHVRQGGSVVALPPSAEDDGDGDGDDSGGGGARGGAGGDPVEAAAFERLVEDAASVDSVEGYDAFKRRLQTLSISVLPLDKRTMLAQEIYVAWGRSEGLTKTDIKRELKPIKKGLGPTRSQVPDWAQSWVYIEKTCEFYHSGLHYAIKREAFDSKHGREVECVIADTSAARLTLNEYQIDTVVDLMFWPGAGLTYEYEGKRMLNSYRDTGIVPALTLDDDGQRVVDLFMAHLRFVIADPVEQRMMIDFMAWVVQRPGQKINWSIVLQGAQGTGKSYFGAVMMLVLGEMARNVEPSALSGRFTGWAHGATLVIVEEIRVVSENRYETIDRLKPFIANATVSIEEKGRDHRTVPNFSSYLMFTNHKDALPLGAGDRRYAPIFGRVQTEEQLFAELGGIDGAGDYFAQLFSESERRADALSRFLRDWQISPTFNAKGRAPHTRARDSMMALAISPERSAIEDAIEKYVCAAINDTVLDVTWLNRLCEGEGESLPKTRAITAILLDMGYEQVKDRRIKIRKTGTYHYIWRRDCDDDAAKVAVRNYHLGPIHGEPGEDVPF